MPKTLTKVHKSAVYIGGPIGVSFRPSAIFQEQDTIYGCSYCGKPIMANNVAFLYEREYILVDDYYVLCCRAHFDLMEINLVNL